MSEANTLLANVRIGMRRLGERRRSRAKEMRAARAPASAVEVNNMGGNPWCDLCGEAGGRVGGGRWWACWPGGMDPCAYATAACALMCAPACAPRYSVRYVFCVSGAWRRVWGDRALLEAASPAGLALFRAVYAFTQSRVRASSVESDERSHTRSLNRYTGLAVPASARRSIFDYISRGSRRGSIGYVSHGPRRLATCAVMPRPLQDSKNRFLSSATVKVVRGTRE